jgi:hypothetical protein
MINTDILLTKSAAKESYNESLKKIIKFYGEFKMQAQHTTIKNGSRKLKLTNRYWPTFANLNQRRLISSKVIRKKIF